jgi:hemolysin D
MTKAMATLPTRPASVIPMPGSSAARAPRLTATDREFLPAAIEILVTPPSPVARSLLLAICALFVSALAWSYFGWIDIHAVAQGKIQPSGRSKVVQPLEAGRVVGINVENGSRVNAGDVLLELDPTETSADREAQASDLGAARAEAARRKAAIAAALTETFAPQPMKFTDDIEQSIRQREANVMIADLAQLRSSVMSLKAQLAEKLATKERLISTISARQKLIALAKERVSMREQIDAKGAGSRALTIEALQQLENYVTTDAGDRGQLLETDASVHSLTRKMEETVSQFIADQTQKLAEIERKRDRTEQELIKAQSKTDRTQLKSPIDGTVQQLSITTVGQVVTSGQSLLTVVPLEGPIEVEAMIANKDIGFVEPGQPAIVKIEAFPFTRYGTVDATVSKVSRDAVDERDATNLSDAATVTKPQPGASTAQQQSRTQNLVFPAALQLAQRSLLIDGKEVPLTPGMAVIVEIKTGSRRAIDFVLSPLREVTVQAGRER